MPDKVFCKDCKHFANDSEFKKFKKDIIKVDWFTSSVLNDKPLDINKNNDCRWFEKGELK